MARPAKFEREEVLERAMQTFWKHGYCATSMARLVETTRLKPGSLYGAFESKSALFLAAIDHYAATSIERVSQVLADAGSPLQGIRDYLLQLAEEIDRPTGRQGCFLVNTVLELARQDESVRERVDHHLQSIEALFRQQLEAAQKAGELPASRDPEQLAALLITGIWGLRVLAGTAPAPGRARSVVDQLLAMLA